MREWVPVEHRLSGLDRRTFKPGLITLVVALVLIYGLSAVNAAIPWHDEIKAGEVLDLGAGATAVPPVGWRLESGTLTGANPASLDIELGKGGATIDMLGAAYSGTADDFLDQVERAGGDDKPGVSGSRGTLTTDGGLVGVVQISTGPGGEGLDAAFKMSAGTALLVRARTAPGQFEQSRDTVTALLRSISPGATR